MYKHLLPACLLLIMLISAKVNYAANEKPCSLSKLTEEKITSLSSKPLLQKSGTIKISEIVSIEQPSPGQPKPVNKKPNPADPFESIITPFLKFITPHFYDQIIKRESKPSLLPA